MRVRDVVDILDTPPHQPLDYIEGRFLFERARLVFSGPWKAGKSTLVLQLALCLATGQSFLDFTVLRRCKVLWLNGEMDEYTVYERVIKTGVRPERGWLIIDSSPPESTKLDTQEGFFYVESLLKKHRPHVVIFDPISKFFNVSENESWSMRTGVFDKLDHFREAHGVALVIVHHTRKAGMQDVGPLEERSRGTGVFQDWPDSIMSLTRDAGGKRKLAFTLRRNPDFLASLDFTFDKERWWCEREGNRDHTIQRLIKVALASEGPLARKPLLDLCSEEHHRSAVMMTLDEMLRQGLVREENGIISLGGLA